MLRPLLHPLLAAPFFAMVSAMVVWAIIPFAAPIGGFSFQITDVNIGFLMVFAVTSLGVYGAVLAGWSSNNKYAILGATRSTAQMLSYEIFLGLSLVGLFMVYGSVQVSTLVAQQNTYWFGDVIPRWGVFTQPVAESQLSLVHAMPSLHWTGVPDSQPEAGLQTSAPSQYWPLL